jgi:glycosyltransferase involved in cell wall biosynthesis
MKILIVTQAVDLDDPVLGFFHRWLEVFATRFDSIEVICLKEGKHALPANVRVHSLGKENGRPRFGALTYAIRFKLLAWRLHRDYDAVFVHMNEEYMLIAGLLWYLLKKKVVLWRNFRYGSWMTPLAARLAHTVCYTSAESFTRRYANSVQMPIGIDTGLFAPAAAEPAPDSILFFGRLDEIKKPHVFLEALHLVREKGVPFSADIVGDPTAGNEAYAEELKKKYGADPSVIFHSGTTNQGAVGVYQAHAIYVNLTPPGSFDKTIGEAMAAGCIVVAANDAVKENLPLESFVSVTPESAATGIEAMLALPAAARERARIAARDYIIRTHSLELLADRLSSLY